jgi:hypothetical protein
LVNEQNLNKELFDWAQNRLERGKFPCVCGHFESSHVKRMCIACHGKDQHGEGCSDEDYTCWHPFEQMDNLTLIEWMSKYKGEEK